MLGEVLARRGRLDEAITALVPPAPQDLDESELAALKDARTRWETRRAELERLEADARRDDVAAETLLSLAEIRLATGDSEGAAALAQRAEPRVQGAAGLRRAALLLGRAGRPSEGADLLSRLGAEMSPTDLINLGVLLEESGDPERAADAFRRGLAAGGPAADAHAGLARVALARGDRAQVVKELGLYLESSPPAELAARAKEALGRLEPVAAPRPGGAGTRP